MTSTDTCCFPKRRGRARWGNRKNGSWLGRFLRSEPRLRGLPESQKTALFELGNDIRRQRIRGNGRSCQSASLHVEILRFSDESTCSAHPSAYILLIRSVILLLTLFLLVFLCFFGGSGRITRQGVMSFNKYTRPGR